MKSAVSVSVAALLAGSAQAQEPGWLKVGGSKGALQYENVDRVDTPDDRFTYTQSVMKNGVKLPVRLSKIGYSGKPLGENVFGALVDQNDEILLNDDGTMVISPAPDFSSMLFDKETGDSLFMLTHFEGPRPGVAYLTHLEHDVTKCELNPVKHTPVSNKDEGGMWIPCAGSVTPWGTHLGSEEYEPDARSFEEGVNSGVLSENGELQPYVGNQADDIKDFMRFFQKEAPTLEDYKTKFFPYKYGHPWELRVDKPTGEYTIKKHYAFGRVAFELCMTTPDGKTSYCTDDGSNVGFFKFESTTVGSYDAGELFCGKFEQTDATNGGAFNVEWVSLGTVADADAELKAIAETTKFSDIFDVADYDDDGATCPEGFKAVFVGGRADNNFVECLKLKDDSAATRQKAAFFETRRMCAMLGGTTEFTKWEGITIDEDTNTIYTAVTTVGRGMAANSTRWDTVSGDHVRVEENPCGCIYKLSMAPGTMSVASMEGLVCGEPLEDGDADADSKQCSENMIAAPDNVAMIQGYNELLIAEDGGWFNHLWTLNLASEELTRIATVPKRGEATGTGGYHFSDVGGVSDESGCDYVIISNQRPDIGAATVAVLGANSYNVSIPSHPTIAPTASPSVPAGDEGDEGAKEEEDPGLSNGAKAGLSLGIFFAVSAVLFIYLLKFNKGEQDLLIANPDKVEEEP